MNPINVNGIIICWYKIDTIFNIIYLYPPAKGTSIPAPILHDFCAEYINWKYGTNISTVKINHIHKFI